MGWDFTKNASKTDIVAYLVKPWDRDGIAHVTTAQKVVGKTLWTVRQDGDTKHIGCYLLDNQRGFGWGYKSMSEGMHPFQYDCPLSFLDMAPVACQEWRDKVRLYHDRNNRIFQIGETVKLDGCAIPEVVITSVKPFRGEFGGKLYRLKKDLIAV